jgi:hypothetical protein
MYTANTPYSRPTSGWQSPITPTTPFTPTHNRFPSTSSSRSPSHSPPPPPSESTVRIILAGSFEDADAALVYPTTGMVKGQLAPSIVRDASVLDSGVFSRPYLLVGPALKRFNASGRRLPKGARAHPYRMLRSSSSSSSSHIQPCSYP